MMSSLISFYLLSVVIAINGIAPSFSEMDCSENAVTQCTNVMQTVMNNSTLMFPNQEDGFDAACGYYNQVVACITQLADRCFESHSKDAFLGKFSGMISVMSDFCTAGSPFRAEFLKHVSCYQSIDKKLISCVDKFSAETDALKTAKLSDKEKAKMSCCYLKASEDCLVASAQKKCGRAAADLIKQTVQKAYGMVIEMCSNLQFYTASCISAASSITSSGFLFLILLIIMSLKH